jgi:hypothetical protein
VDCPAPVSDSRFQRCGPHAQQERNRRRRDAANCTDCGRAISGGRATRCNRCGQIDRRLRRADGRVLNELLVCPLDGLAVKQHPRCGICTALTGDVHMQRFAGRTSAGVAVCDSCERMVRRAEGSLAAVGGGGDA